MTTVFHTWPYGRFIEIQSNLRRKKLHRPNQGSNFLGGSFSNRDNARAPIQFRSGELCYNFAISKDLTQIVNFPTRIPDCDFHSPALLDLFISSDASICSTKASPPLENSYHVVVSVSIDSPSYSKRDAPFHCIAYDYSRADWDGVHDHLRDVPWKDKFKLLLLLVNFVSGFRLEFMYMSLIESIRSSLTHLHGFQLLVLLPYFIEINFVCTNRINLLNLK